MKLQEKHTQGYFKIIFYTAHVVRVIAHYAPLVIPPSYAVIADPKPTKVSFKDLETHLLYQTKHLRLIIDKQTFTLRFETIDKQIINEDDSAFGLTWTGQEATVYKKLQPQERFIGLGEKPGDLNRKGTGHTNWNTDYFAYPLEADSIYSSFPFYIGIHDNLQYGIFLDSSYKTHFNFGASNNRFSSFSTEHGPLDYYFIYGKNTEHILKHYGYLTGTCPLPPSWALGYQQSRYSYYPDRDVLTLAETFRSKKIPADVIYLDIHYMEGYKLFTWDKENFHDPKALIDKLATLGFKLVVILDPGIKVEDSYDVYRDGLEANIFIKYPDQSNYTAGVWPGWCHFPDFTNPKTRDWWAKWLEVYTKIGIKGFWNDMNEIATWGQRLPDFIEFNHEGHKATAKHMRNVYGLLMCRSTFEGAEKHLPNTRPFLLTRAAYPGVQRYSAIWTGDNVSSDDHMLLGIRQILSLGLTGVAFSGYDFGGFVGEADVHLYVRWLTLAVFSPFLRNHTMINTRSTEPWTFGEEAEEIARNYINFRYQLFPYLYSMFYLAHKCNLPVARSLVLDYDDDDAIYSPKYQNQYLFGAALLIIPVKSNEKIADAYLPNGNWYDLYNDTLLKGNKNHFVKAPLERLPVFVKAGSIIPMQAVQQNLSQKPSDTLYLHIYKDNSDTIFDYYEDDGESLNYQKKEYYKRKVYYYGKMNFLKFKKTSGNYKSKFKKIKLLLHGFKPLKNININGKNSLVKQEKHQIFKPISNFDPLGKQAKSDNLNLQTIIFSLKNKKIEIWIRSILR